MSIGKRLLLFGTVILTGCQSRGPSDSEDLLVWGGPGNGNGQFQRPRAIGVLNEEVYVIDTTGRIQVFTEQGEYVRQWSVPESKNGTPTAIEFDSDGNVLVPDTHYSKIIIYSATGEILKTWGSYGAGENEFIYPTGIVRGKNGFYYVSEYGIGAERIHVFDSEGRFVMQWGKSGDGDGEFSRAMDVGMDGNGDLYVADTVNHRIQIFDPEGKFLGIVGKPGRKRGELDFPYDLDVAPDGSILVSEYGNHRISRFTKDGKFVGSVGRAGRRPGEFDGPRGVAVSEDGFVFVADTDNHRVQRLPLEAIR